MTCSIHQRQLVLKEARESANRALREERMIMNKFDNVVVSESADSAAMSSTTSSLVLPPPSMAEHYPTTTYEAKEHVSMFLQSSHRMGKHIHEIPTFDSRELILGRWLGKGGFSDVDELRGFVHIPDALRTKRRRTAMQLFAKLRNHRPEDDDLLVDTSEESKAHSYVPTPEELGYESHRGKEHSETTTLLEDSANSYCEHKQQLRRYSSCSSYSSAADCPSAQDNDKDNNKIDHQAGRQFLIKNCVRDSGEARYAIKRLRKEIVEDPNQYPAGAMDLAVEALFLADLAHPNIVKLRGIATCDPFASTREDHHFLILDRLQDTLTARIRKWKERKRKLNTILGRITDVGGRKRQQLLDERLAAAFDLSAAMAYLKQNRILHRDIKPENLGFDIRGDIKIFDFGLARELRDMDKDPDLPGMYRLSNMTGSLRYMAPEVASMGTPYNESCDVYSFTIVLWEMLSLRRAFMTVGRSREGFMQKVHQEKRRPPIRHSWSRNLRNLLQRGWDHDHTKRLTAEQCNEILRNELVSMRHGDDEGLDHSRRRSTYVLENDESSTRRSSSHNNLTRSSMAFPMRSASTNTVVVDHYAESSAF